MNLNFETHGNEKQKECCRAWNDDSVTDIYFGGAKGGCFAHGTLIKTSKGYFPINEIKEGDNVLSFNEKYQIAEYKKVLEIFSFGGGKLKKMITFKMKDNIQIKCTDNHEFYFEGIWQPASGLARRILGFRSKHEQPLFNFNERQTFYDEFQEQREALYNETLRQPKRVLENGDSERRGEQEYNNAQVSSVGIYTQSAKPSASEPYRLQSGKQLRRKFRVDNGKRKYGSFLNGWKIKRIYERLQTEKPKQGIKGSQLKINGGASKRDQIKIHPVSLYQGNAWERIWSGPFDNKGRNFEKLAACEINIHEVVGIKLEYSFETVYDLCVEDNHNYIITEQNIIVHNSKSFTECTLTFADALTYPGTRYFISRKKLNDLRKFTIPTISKVFDSWKIKQSDYVKFNGQDNLFDCYNGSKVLFLEAAYMPSDPLYERFGSMEFTRGSIDEAGEFDLAAKNNLAASVGRWKNDEYGLMRKLLQTGNPSKNYTYRDYYIPWRDGKLKPYQRFIPAFIQDNKMIDKGYIEQLEQTLTKNEKERLLYGNWEYDDDPAALIEYDKILDVFTNTHVPHGAKKITADIARLGGDRIVIIEWDGWRGKVKHYTKQGLDVTAGIIEDLRYRMQIGTSDVLVDEDGMGGGVVDFMKFKGFVNNSSPLPAPNGPIDDKGNPIKENYDNLKSQCYFRMAERINRNELYLECDSEDVKQWIIEELEQVKQKALDSDLKKGVMPKDKVKELIGRSPDFSDAIMQREYFELKPKKVWAWA